MTQLVTTTTAFARFRATTSDCHNTLTCSKQTQPDRPGQNVRAWRAEGQGLRIPLAPHNPEIPVSFATWSFGRISLGRPSGNPGIKSHSGRREIIREPALSGALLAEDAVSMRPIPGRTTARDRHQ